MANDPTERREIQRLRAELRGRDALLAEIMATIPVGETLAATRTGPALVAYFKDLHRRADLCASPLPPPGSEAEAEMVERAAAALNRDMRTARAIATAVLRAAFGGSDGEGRSG